MPPVVMTKPASTAATMSQRRGRARGLGVFMVSSLFSWNRGLGLRLGVGASVRRV
jgi:hypothetical protein